jgi:hypothetical protein
MRRAIPPGPTAAVRVRTAAAAAALLTLASCSYAPAVAHHRFANAMPEPGGHRLAVIVLTRESRESTGFLARFPDGGRAKILAERMKLWLCDADRGTAAELATLPRPADVRSGFTAWIVGWDPPGESAGVYVEVSGRRGATSDTPLLRWLLRVGVDPVPGRSEALAFLPNEAVRPPGPGPLRGGRQLQLSLGADSIAVRADTRPDFAPMFRLDPASGGLALLPGAAPLGAPESRRTALRRGSADSVGPSLLRPRARPPSGPRAAPAIWCDSVQLFLRQFAAAPIRRGDEFYEDPLAVRPHPACSIQLDEPWSGVDPSRTPWDALGEWLLGHEFTRDIRYDADGPDGSAALYRRGDRFCAYAATWRTDRPAAGKRSGGPEEEPPTRYRLTVWSGVVR